MYSPRNLLWSGHISRPPALERHIPRVVVRRGNAYSLRIRGHAASKTGHQVAKVALGGDRACAIAKQIVPHFGDTSIGSPSAPDLARISRGFYLTFSTLGCGERHTVPTVDETVPLTPDAPRHGPWPPGQRTARIVRSPSPRSGGLRGITHPPRGHAEDAAPGLRVARAPRASGIVGSGVRPALVAQDAAAGVRLWRACRAYPRARAEEFLTGAATSGQERPTETCPRARRSGLSTRTCVTFSTLQCGERQVETHQRGARSATS